MTTKIDATEREIVVVNGSPVTKTPLEKKNTKEQKKLQITKKHQKIQQE